MSYNIIAKFAIFHVKFNQNTYKTKHTHTHTYIRKTDRVTWNQNFSIDTIISVKIYTPEK